MGDVGDLYRDFHKYLDPRPESIMDDDRQFRRAY